MIRTDHTRSSMIPCENSFGTFCDQVSLDNSKSNTTSYETVEAPVFQSTSSIFRRGILLAQNGPSISLPAKSQPLTAEEKALSYLIENKLTGGLSQGALKAVIEEAFQKPSKEEAVVVALEKIGVAVIREHKSVRSMTGFEMAAARHALKVIEAKVLAMQKEQPRIDLKSAGPTIGPASTYTPPAPPKKTGEDISGDLIESLIESAFEFVERKPPSKMGIKIPNLYAFILQKFLETVDVDPAELNDVTAFEDGARRGAEGIQKALEEIESGYLALRTGSIHYNGEREGQVYTGSLQNGLPHGRGAMTYPQKFKFEGEFNQGNKIGKGTLIYEDGSQTEVEIVDGGYHPLKITIPGKFTYEGSFNAERLPHGKGKITYATGLIYEGKFAHAKKDGKGKLTFQSGTTGEYIFKNDSAVSTSNLDLGNGTTYKGKVKASGVPHGKGKLFKNGKLVYEGDFKKGVPSGRGVYIDRDGTRIDVIADKGVLRAADRGMDKGPSDKSSGGGQGSDDMTGMAVQDGIVIEIFKGMTIE